jgi:hypothetical protein
VEMHGGCYRHTGRWKRKTRSVVLVGDTDRRKMKVDAQERDNGRMQERWFWQDRSRPALL